MRRWTRPSPAEPDRAILSNVWTTSTCYKPLEIERPFQLVINRAFTAKSSQLARIAASLYLGHVGDRKRDLPLCGEVNRGTWHEEASLTGACSSPRLPRCCDPHTGPSEFALPR